MENRKVTVNLIPRNILEIALVILLVCKIFNLGIAGELSWWWITSPIWIPAAIAVILIVGFAVITFIVEVLTLIFKG